MPYKPGVMSSMPGFSTLSEETLNQGPTAYDLRCWWDVNPEHNNYSLYKKKCKPMERLYCLLVTAFLLLSQLLVISCAFIIILDAVDIMLCIHTIISQANAIVAFA